MTSTKKKQILITAARSPVALDLARQLHLQGHKVFVAETCKYHICKFSNSVAKSFVVPSSRFKTEEFINSIIDITHKEKIDLVIPIYEEIVHLSKTADRFPSHCQIFCPSFSTLNELHNKWFFYKKQKSLGIEAPKTELVKSLDDLKNLNFSTPYALKASYSRASLNVKKVYPGDTLPNIKIEKHNPWLAQEWLVGNKYCTYSICHEGNVKAHATYPVQFAIDNNSCITFESIEHEPVRQWVEKFVKLVNFTGQIAFDFIELPNKKLYAIECNPRATSGVHLFGRRDRIDTAFFNQCHSPVYPKLKTKRQLASGMLLYGWKKSSHPKNHPLHFLKTFLSIKDVVFSLRDPKPFLLQPFVFTGIWLTSKRAKRTLTESFTHDNEWNGDPAEVLDFSPH